MVELNSIAPMGDERDPMAVNIRQIHEYISNIETGQVAGSQPAATTDGNTDGIEFAVNGFTIGGKQVYRLIGFFSISGNGSSDTPDFIALPDHGVSNVDLLGMWARSSGRKQLRLPSANDDIYLSQESDGIWIRKDAFTTISKDAYIDIQYTKR